MASFSNGFECRVCKWDDADRVASTQVNSVCGNLINSVKVSNTNQEEHLSKMKTGSFNPNLLTIDLLQITVDLF